MCVGLGWGGRDVLVPGRRGGLSQGRCRDFNKEEGEERKCRHRSEPGRRFWKSANLFPR